MNRIPTCPSLQELIVVDAADSDTNIYEEPMEWSDPNADTKFRRIHESLVCNDFWFYGTGCNDDQLIDFQLAWSYFTKIYKFAYTRTDSAPILTSVKDPKSQFRALF